MTKRTWTIKKAAFEAAPSSVANRAQSARGGGPLPALRAPAGSARFVTYFFRKNLFARVSG